jgi:hypothetical protein
MLSRFKLEEGWFTLLLVWSLVIIAAATTLDAELMDGLEFLPLIATVAVFSGVLLAKSRFSSRTTHIIALVYGLALLTYLLGSNLPESMTWQERIFDLVERQFIWISKALSSGSSRDGLIFVIHTSAVFWLLGYTAAWYTFREPKVWRVVLPSGLVLMSVVYYYYGPKPLAAYLARRQSAVSEVAWPSNASSCMRNRFAATAAPPNVCWRRKAQRSPRSTSCSRLAAATR